MQVPVVGIFRVDLDLFLEKNRTRIKACIHNVDRYSSMWLLVSNFPEYRIGPAVLRKQTGMEVEEPARGQMKGAFRDPVRVRHDEDGVGMYLLEPGSDVPAVRHQEREPPLFGQSREVVGDVVEKKRGRQACHCALFQ